MEGEEKRKSKENKENKGERKTKHEDDCMRSDLQGGARIAHRGRFYETFADFPPIFHERMPASIKENYVTSRLRYTSYEDTQRKHLREHHGLR